MGFTKCARLGLLAFVVASVLAAVTVPVQGQDEVCNNFPVSPRDLFLHLSLKGGQTIFRQGEIIALIAEYKASTPRKYSLNNRSYDRVGRLDGVEVFCIEPSPRVDPLAEYFKSQMAFIGGGLFSDQDPAIRPLTVELELNEWQAMPPGSYRLSIVGNRAVAQLRGDISDLRGTHIPLRSNIIEFQVLKAEPEWQAEQLGAAETTLDAQDSTKEARRHAARVLRFLGSEAATFELVRRLWLGEESISWEMKLGLWGSAFRESALREMKADLKNPEHSVTRDFVDTLVALEMQSDPKYRPPNQSEDGKPDWSHFWDDYQTEFNRRVAEYWAEAPLRSEQ